MAEATPRRKIRNYVRVRQELLAQQGGKCLICGRMIDLLIHYKQPGAGVIDHVIPLAMGGADDRSNYAVLHSSCNGAKSDKPLALARKEFLSQQKYPAIFQ